MSNRGALIVTGGGRGIGAAICRVAARDGWPVVVNYGKSHEAASRVADQIVSTGGRAVAFGADVADEAAVMAMFDEADALFGRIGGVVNNAGITGGFSRVGAIEANAVRRMLDVNVLGTMLCCREAARRMSTTHGGTGGSIVNISSLATRTGGSHEWVHYAASKGAIDTFTIGMAREVAAEGIRVNAVAPGLIESDLHADNGDPGRPARMAPSIPMQRSGQPEEIAEGVVWLLSPAASYVTGAILEIGGGR
ncbi:MAG: SDR family oxidoreductase [Thermomicrobiales bacterium]|nr:SDR family oxidoreductase [Thermomicrobiales bacterium]